MKPKLIPITPKEARYMLCQGYSGVPGKVQQKLADAYPKIQAELEMDRDLKGAIESKLNALIWQSPEVVKANKKRDEANKVENEVNAEFWDIKRAVEKKLKGDPELYERLKAEALKEIQAHERIKALREEKQ